MCSNAYTFNWLYTVILSQNSCWIYVPMYIYGTPAFIIEVRMYHAYIYVAKLMLYIIKCGLSLCHYLLMCNAHSPILKARNMHIHREMVLSKQISIQSAHMYFCDNYIFAGVSFSIYVTSCSCSHPYIRAYSSYTLAYLCTRLYFHARQ